MVPPPSRGRLNAGAFAPSVKGPETGAEGVGRGAGDPPALSTGSFRTGATTRLAAAAFGAAIAGEADFSGLDDFNFFDGALCDAFAVGLPVCFFFVLLPDLVVVLAAVALRAFEDAFADLAGRARIVFPAAGLGDFLRVFLDIRLPFVAFRGSTIGVLRQAGIEQTVR